MPELPEVETLRRTLERQILGRPIQKIRVRETRLRTPVSVRRLKRSLTGFKIERISRRSKYLLCHLTNAHVLVIHLGMSGRLHWLKSTQPFDKHDHVIFTFDDGTDLRFQDPRRFGLVDALLPAQIDQSKYFKNLGLEPLTDEFTADWLWQKTQGVKKPIKNFLMDAQRIVGVGNIYACESLYQAKISPKKHAGRLTQTDSQLLVAAVRSVLEAAIAQGGTTLNDFQDSSGKPGYFQVYLAVYGRAGESCMVCQQKIRRIVMAGRSTFFCKHCQK